LIIATSLSQLSECNEVPNVLSAVQNALSNKGVETEMLKKEHEIQEAKIQTEIDTLRMEKGKLEQNIQHKKSELSRNKIDLSKLKADILEVGLYFKFKVFKVITVN
jgi:predicted nuclease with TOPRIM domain